MSNENSTTNLPRKKKAVNTLQRSSVGRNRNFACITYLNETALKLVLLLHSHQIRVYAYAYHDKDTYEDDVIDEESGEVVHEKGNLKEPHYHILLILNNCNTLSAVRRWFYGYKDKDNKDINTLVQVSRDKYFSFDYLTHNTAECMRQGKYLYPSDIVVSNDINHFKGHYSADFDSAQLILLDFLKGTPYKEMAMKYGRDFILNFEKYKTFATEMHFHEKFNPPDYDPSQAHVVYHTYYNSKNDEYEYVADKQEYLDLS